ncbi:MAG: hypothetical protein BroJett040_14710 [Oligoflexia bacterium]|nr:MAG: hypothetical protein BroJett040_14710 [Oligoflexia bacterium]
MPNVKIIMVVLILFISLSGQADGGCLDKSKELISSETRKTPECIELPLRRQIATCYVASGDKDEKGHEIISNYGDYEYWTHMTGVFNRKLELNKRLVL